ncbi:hypothetical protein PG997_008616 [Apiospora hydei]|uniref:Uncharacterized protein n=1 Tax=Apiospora hydei TaxID=1337664 RepID=A0ABR1WBI0_9PEZI
MEEALIVSENMPDYSCISCGEHPVVGQNKTFEACRIAAQDRRQQQALNRERVDKEWAQKYGKDRPEGGEREPARCVLCRATPAMDGEPRCYNCTMIGHARAAKDLRRNEHRRAKTQAELARRRRQELIEQGRCHRCESEWPEDGQQECAKCGEAGEARKKAAAERKRELRAVRYASIKSQGLCAQLGPEAWERKLRAQQQRRDEIKRMWLCVQCEKALAESGKTRCAKCLERVRKGAVDPEAWQRMLRVQKQRREEIKRKGLCTLCRSRPPRAEMTYYEPCALEKSRKKRGIKPSAREDDEVRHADEPMQDVQDIDGGDLYALGEEAQESHPVPAVEEQENSRQGLLDTVSQGVDRMAIDFLLC